MLATRTYAKSFLPLIGKRFKSDNFEAGDYVIITPLKKTVTKKQWLSRPLKDSPGSTVNLNFGRIPHSDLIGAAPLGKVHTIETKSKLAKYICAKPSLEQWINLSQRKATPIYAFDAQAIVTLADLHVNYAEPPTEDGGKVTPLQFLEAGTGHGSLTLAIAKALHPANALAYYAKDTNLRGAVLHSIDCNSSHSVTEGPSAWVKSEEGKNWMERELVSKREGKEIEDTDDPEAFLSGIFLDMPNYHEEMVKLAPYLKTGGFIIVFCPSITQIVDAIDAIADEDEKLAKLDVPKSLHLEHERTIQLLDGAGGGLKEWDTRRAMIRATGKIGYSVRPKVGVRTVAGGFVAIWRKLGTDVNLEAERELMETYAGKPDSNSDVAADDAEIENSNDSVAEYTQEIKAEEIKSEELKVDTINSEELKSETLVDTPSLKISRAEKESLYPPDLLSTEKDVLEHERSRNEIDDVSIQEQFPDVDFSGTESEGFEIEEAKLIPHSVLHTVFRSCHGDPDVHVGYISGIKVFEFEAPENFDEEASTERKDEHDKMPTEDFQTTEKSTSSSSVFTKKWIKHTI